MRRHFNWLWVSLAIFIILFVSSSMPYKAQTLVPALDNLLPKNSPFAWLNTIHFTYDGSVVSIEHLGFAKFVEFFLRKLAHFGTFAIFGFATTRGLAPMLKQRWLLCLNVFFVSMGLAAFDEIHQMITGGRTPLFQDVVLDTVGASFGLLIALLILLRRKRR